jgi:mRNA interferase RelE/StbE
MKLYRIEFKTSAHKEIQRLPRIIQVKILDTMRLLAASPFSPLLPIRKMEGASNDNRFRLRIGKYRVVYEVQKDRVVIFVIRIGHRKDVYR